MIPYLAFATFAAVFGWTLLLTGKRNKHKHLRPTYVTIQFTHHHGKHTRKEHYAMAQEIKVGETKTAVVVVLDQNRNEFPFDFSTNQPSWSVDQPSNVGLAAGSQPQDESYTGLAATTTNALLSVSVPGVVNPTDTKEITVIEAPPPPLEPTFVEIRFV
jgi:hypothetical protein